MKFFIVAVALVAVVVAQEPVAILRQAQDISPEGSYQYSHETADGIAVSAAGALKTVGDQAGNSVQGSFQYTAPDGTPIAVSYVADENGFQPQGAHLPQPHPVPEAILRAIEYIRTHPQPQEQQ